MGPRGGESCLSPSPLLDVQVDGISPLKSFEAAGIALLLRNEPTKSEKGNTISLPKRQAAAASAWSRGGEATEDETCVFECSEVHHLVLADKGFARASAGALLGVSKVLATEHEIFVDELHVAPAGKGKGLSYHLLDAINLLQEPPDKQVRLQVKVDNQVAVHAYEQASFVQWTPPVGGVWDEKDEAEEGAMMMSTNMQKLADAVAHRCRHKRLAPCVETLHFLDGEEVDHVVSVPTTDEHDDGERQPRTEKERLAETCGTLNLHAPLAKMLIGRSLWNAPICDNSKASSAGYHLSCDAGNFKGKGIDRRCKQISLVAVALKCWGVGDGDGWYDAHVCQAMPLSQSVDKCEVLRAWLGDDHAANLERGFVPYSQLRALTKQRF